MNKLKKALAAVLAVATIATVFTGCGNKKNEETFKTAMANTANLESCKMTGEILISMLEDAPQEEGKEDVTNTATMPMLSMNYDATMMDKGLTTAMTMDMSMLGMGGTAQTVYMKDGATYTSMDDGQTFIKQDMVAGGMDPTKLQEMGLKYNAQFMEKLDYSKVKYEKVEEGLSAEFSVTKDMYSDLFKEAINEMYPNGLEEDVRKETHNNLLAMGLTEEEIATPEMQAEIDAAVESATKMFDIITNGLEFNKFDIKVIINGDQVTQMTYDMEINLTPIMESLQTEVPEMAGMFPENMRVGIKMDSKLSEINAITAVEMPEFTEENTMTMEEMMQKSMEEAGITDEMLNELDEQATEEAPTDTTAVVPAA